VRTACGSGVEIEASGQHRVVHSLLERLAEIGSHRTIRSIATLALGMIQTAIHRLNPIDFVWKGF
jgi:hypothetical protein